MTRYCTVCVHPSRQEIEQLLEGKPPYGVLDKVYGVSRFAALRHQQNHMGKAQQETAEPTAEPQIAPAELPVANGTIRQEAEEKSAAAHGRIPFRNYPAFSADFLDYLRRLMHAMGWRSFLCDGNVVGGSEQRCMNFLGWLKVGGYTMPQLLAAKAAIETAYIRFLEDPVDQKMLEELARLHFTLGSPRFTKYAAGVDVPSSRDGLQHWLANARAEEVKTALQYARKTARDQGFKV